VLAKASVRKGRSSVTCRPLLVHGDGTIFHTWVSYLCPRQLGYGAASFGTIGQILIGLNVLNRFPHWA